MPVTITFADGPSITRKSDGKEVSPDSDEDTDQKRGIINISRRRFLIGSAMAGAANASGVGVGDVLGASINIEETEVPQYLLQQLENGDFSNLSSDHPFSLVYDTRDSIAVSLNNINTDIGDKRIAGEILIKRADGSWETFGHHEELIDDLSSNSFTITADEFWSGKSAYYPSHNGNAKYDLIEGIDQISESHFEPAITPSPGTALQPDAEEVRNKFTLRYLFESSNATIQEEKTIEFEVWTSIEYGFGMNFGTNFGRDHHSGWESHLSDDDGDGVGEFH